MTSSYQIYLGDIMRTRVTAAGAALLLAALTACGSSDSGTTTKESPSKKPKVSASAAQPSVNCSDQSLDQAEWMEHCADKATGDGQATGLKFGESYTWPDGLKVSVVEAKVFTDYDTEFEEPTKGGTDFRLKLKLTNTGKAPADLDDITTIVEGATNGGEAASASFTNGAAPLDGRLAPGVTVTKTDDNTLETKYGRKVVVTVQRASENFDLEFPEFTGTITG